MASARCAINLREIDAQGIACSNDEAWTKAGEGVTLSVELDEQRSFPVDIAGYPAEETVFQYEGLILRLVTVARLENHINLDVQPDPKEPGGISGPPYWAHLWVGARALARSLATRPGFGAGVKVLDLGCGLGLPGLVAAARGAEVWFGDCEPAALAFVCESLSRNGITGGHPVVLDFTQDLLGIRFDQILGAEIVYDSSSYALLAEFIDRHLANDGTFHVTDAFRGDAVRFFDNLRSRGFRGERFPVREWENGNWQGAFIWDFRR